MSHVKVDQLESNLLEIEAETQNEAPANSDMNPKQERKETAIKL